VKLEALRRTALGGGLEFPPFLRTYRGDIWTVATNGHGLVATRERLTSNIDGPAFRLRQLGPFERRPILVEVDRLRAFLNIARPPLGDVANLVAEPIRVAGVVLNRLLLRRLLRPVPSGPVKLRAEASDIEPLALRIEGRGFLVICMGMHVDSPRATFRGGRRAG
jgi:hypothetical protein